MNFVLVDLFASINLLAVLTSAVIYFFLGALWFSVLFGRAWALELEKQNIFIKEPTAAQLMIKMGTTFIGNCIASLSMALLVQATNSVSLVSAVELGLLVAIGFAATTMSTSYVWIGKPIKGSLIDIGYPVVGIMSSAVILSLWR